MYKLISDGDTDGVFQLESAGMKQFLTNMKPENFEDVIAAISLYRPGPMESIPRYIQGKHDPSSVRYETPLLKPILDVTYGCMVYQEQVMQIVRDLAGYSYGRSDLVRRAMAKKKHDVMAKEKEIFIHGAGGKRRGDRARRGAQRRAGGCGRAYLRRNDRLRQLRLQQVPTPPPTPLVAVQTAWLKLHFPVQFMAALMNSLSGNSDKVGYYIQTCRKRGIRVLPPDVNKSQEKFSVEEGAIRFGFAGVKNLGHGAIQAIVSERGGGRGRTGTFFDLCERVACAAVNKKCVESLIRAGAMDGLPGSRSQKLCVFERAMDAAGRRQKTAVQGQLSLFDAVEDVQIAPPPLPDVPDFSRQEQLRMEREVTGVYITGHPLDEYEAVLSKLEVDSQALQSLSEAADGGMSWDQKLVTMGGIVAERKVKATKSGTMMAFVQLEDMYGLTEVLVFPQGVRPRGAPAHAGCAGAFDRPPLRARGGIAQAAPWIRCARWTAARPLLPPQKSAGGRPQALHQVPGRPARGGAGHFAADAGQHPRHPRQRRNRPRPARAAEVLGGRGLRLLPSGEPFGGEKRRIQIDGHRGGKSMKTPGAVHRHPLLQRGRSPAHHGKAHGGGCSTT